ncbi:MAG: DNA-3-methyladenine glycosylase [Chloroflexi bacterium]|nr:MAG: DNA-3-methyladenine glycosylase [Chloroflexota bacterium]
MTDRAWFDRPALEVAPDLLGARLVHASPTGVVAGRIVEVEAYAGPEDRAAHSSRGRTPRNAVMFGPPGHLYVYFVYGMHHCINVVCGSGSKPEAVLIRAVAIDEGTDLARARRGWSKIGAPLPLAAGPGNVAAAFGIDRSLNGADLTTGPVWVTLGEAPPRIVARPRVGVAYAGDWAALPWRFLVADDRHVSRR